MCKSSAGSPPSATAKLVLSSQSIIKVLSTLGSRRLGLQFSSLSRDLHERHDGVMSWAVACWHRAAMLSASLVRSSFQRTRSEELHLDQRVNWHRHEHLLPAHLHHRHDGALDPHHHEL